MEEQDERAEHSHCRLCCAQQDLETVWQHRHVSRRLDISMYLNVSHRHVSRRHPAAARAGRRSTEVLDVV